MGRFGIASTCLLIVAAVEASSGSSSGSWGPWNWLPDAQAYGGVASSVSEVVHGVEDWARDTHAAVLRGSSAAPASQTTSRAAPPAEAWEALRELLSGWELTQNYALAVGTAEHGRLFVYEGGKFKMTTKIPTGSTSKWPSAMMFAGVVNDGTVSSLDDPVNKYLSWWTKDPKDPRSAVTMRMLLSFTSGFGDGHPGMEANTLAARQWRQARNASWAKADPEMSLERSLVKLAGADAGLKCNPIVGDIVECAKSIYENVQLIGTPGQVWSYNSNHLQLAAAVAVTATGLPIHDVISKYLFEPYGMNNSAYPGSCPDFADSLMTTGDDYEKFLQGVLGNTKLSKEIMEASEEDSTPFMKDYYSLYGDYGFGHFLMCFDSVGGYTDECKQAQCHMDPGAFGFIPIVDRKHKYYMEVVAAEIPPTGSYWLSGVPEYLAIAVKPHIDAIMEGSAWAPEFSHHAPGLLSLSVADVNYCVDCKLHPKNCM